LIKNQHILFLITQNVLQASFNRLLA